MVKRKTKITPLNVYYQQVVLRTDPNTGADRPMQITVKNGKEIEHHWLNPLGNELKLSQDDIKLLDDINGEPVFTTKPTNQQIVNTVYSIEQDLEDKIENFEGFGDPDYELDDLYKYREKIWKIKKKIHLF